MYVFQTLPQALQWWRLQVRVNSQVQIIHMVVRRSGIQIGALEPRGESSAGTSSDWIQQENIIFH